MVKSLSTALFHQILFYAILKYFSFVSFILKFSPLPNDKICDWSKLKAFVDDKINVNEKFQFIQGRVEDIVGKGENADYQHFLLFPQCFQKATFSGSLKVGIVW